MYEQAHRFEESINLAIAKGVPDAEKKKTGLYEMVSGKQNRKKKQPKFMNKMVNL